MHDNAKQKRISRKRRHRRVRARVFGTPQKPRLSVFRSNTFIYVQAIDDSHGVTLCTASDREIKKIKKNITKKDRARMVGALIAERLKSLKLSKAVFDRGGYNYHGRVRALADGAREGGLEF